MTGGPSVVFTRKAVVDDTYIRNSSNVCKSIVGIDASRLYPFTMCQDMPTGLYTRWEFDTEMQKFKARNNQTRNFENMVMSFYQESRPECKIESFFTSGKQKNIDCFNVDGYCDHCKTVFEAMGCYYHFCSSQEACPSLTDQDIERGNKKRERWMICDENTLKRKDTKWKKCGNVTGGKISKPMTRSQQITSEPTFPIKNLFLQTPF